MTFMNALVWGILLLILINFVWRECLAYRWACGVQAGSLEALEVAFPWLKLFPEDEQIAFRRALIFELRACGSSGDYAPLSVFLARWHGESSCRRDEIV